MERIFYGLITLSIVVGITLGIYDLYVWITCNGITVHGVATYICLPND